MSLLFLFLINLACSIPTLPNQHPLDSSDPVTTTDLPTAFLQSDNPLLRDEDEYPDSIDDEGEDYIEGDAFFLLVTSFIQGQKDTGKVWVVPYNRVDDTYILISGLQIPVAVCYDINHHFLYVTDLGTESETGSIYQYEIKQDDDDDFVLDRNVYAVIYSGGAPYGCKVDEFGNLYFLDYNLNQINMVTYLDLYAGFTNTHYTLYEQDESNENIESPVGLEVINSEDIYFVNSANVDEAGTLNQCQTQVQDTNAEDIQVLVESTYEGWAVAYTEEGRLFYALGDGSVWNYDLGTEESQLSYSGFGEPRGLCYADGVIYVADNDMGTIYSLSDTSELQEPGKFIEIQGAYGVFCVNELGLVTLVTSFLILVV